MPNITLPKKYTTWVFVVDEQEMRRLAEECRNALTAEGGTSDSIHIRLSARLWDGATLEHLSLDEFLAIENERRRAIKGAELTAKTGTASIICRFATEPQRASSLTVVGQDRQWVYTTVSRIEDRLRNMTEWYADGIGWLAGFVLTGFASVAVLYLLQLRGVVFEMIPRGSVTELNTAGKFALLSALCAMGAGAIAGRVLFPKVVFRIGYGIRRADIRRDTRSKIGWTIGVGMIVGLALLGLQRLIWLP